MYFDTLPYALYLSDWCINYCQYFGCLSFIGVYMVRYDGIVVDAVSFFEQVGVLAVADFHGSFNNNDELFAILRGKNEIAVVRGSYVNDERLHVAVCF